jgi:putative adhesin
VLLDGVASPLRITAANVSVTAAGLRSPSLTAMITSGQLTASFATPPQQVSLTLSSAHAVLRLPASVSYAVRTQATSGSVQAGVPQATQSSHQVTARLDSSDLQLQPT